MKRLLLFSAALSSMLFAKIVNYDLALKEALQNNMELKAKKLNIDKAQADSEKAQAYDWGKAWIAEDISRSNNALYVFGFKLESREAAFKDFGLAEYNPRASNALQKEPKDLNHPEARTNFKTKLVYEVPIFTGYKIQFAQEMAKLQVKANEYKYMNDKNKLAVEVLKAYNGAVAAKAFIIALEKAKETTINFVKMTNNFYKVGMATQVDVLQARKRDSEVDAMIVEAKAKYALALAYLRFLTGDNLISDVGNFKVVIPPNLSLVQLKDIALRYRNDLKWMKANVDTMKKKVKMDESVTYPTVGAHLEYGWDDKKLTISSGKDYFLVAVGLKYIFYDNSIGADIKKSKVEALQTSYYYEQMKRGIALQVEQKYLELKAKSAILRNKRVNLDLALQILRKYQIMYKEGMVNMTILLMKESEVRKARAELIKAKYDEALAAAELKQALGDLIKENK